jgi:hypothetical protein
MTEIFKKLALLGDVWVLWLLLGASIFSVGVIFERWRVFRRSQVDFPDFIDKLTGFWKRATWAGLKTWFKTPRALKPGWPPRA